MASIHIVQRAVYAPSTKATRRAISFLAAPTKPAQLGDLCHVFVRNSFAPFSARRKTLFVGLLGAGRQNPNVLLYRKQQWPQLMYPRYKWPRRYLPALGQKVAPVIPVGGGGVGMDLQHYLGLSLIKLGGMRY